MSNYYWPTYRSLEKEVLKISDYIHFSDDQVDVYSLHIADLIVRNQKRFKRFCRHTQNSEEKVLMRFVWLREGRH